MFKALLGRQISELLKVIFIDGKGKGRSKTAVILFAALYAFIFVGIIGGNMFATFYAIYGPMASADALWLYFAAAAGLAILLGTVINAFSAGTALFKGRDNELLLSMPIPERLIVLSRLALLYITGALVAALVCIPAFVVYLIGGSATPAGVVGNIVTYFCVTFVISALSCLIGSLSAGISNRLSSRNKGLVLSAVLVVLTAGYVYVYYRAVSAASAFTEDVPGLAENVKNAFYPAYFIGRAVEGEIVPLLVCAGVSILAAFAAVAAVSKSFFSTATGKHAEKKMRYDPQSVNQKGVFPALIGKEFAKLASSPMYLLNGASGAVILIIGGVALLIEGEGIMNAVIGVFGTREAAAVILTGAACFCIGTVDIASISVSIEGKSMWIIRSLPVKSETVLASKIAAHFIISAASGVLFWICATAVSKPGVTVAALDLVFIIAFSLLIAEADLIIDLKRPNTSWINEMVLVKQSMNVGLALLTGFLLTAAFVGSFMAIGAASPAIFLAAACAVAIAAAYALYRVISKKGAALFEAI